MKLLKFEGNVKNVEFNYLILELNTPEVPRSTSSPPRAPASGRGASAVCHTRTYQVPKAIPTLKTGWIKNIKGRIFLQTQATPKLKLTK